MANSGLERQPRESEGLTRNQFLVAAGFGGAGLGIGAYLTFRKIQEASTAWLIDPLRELAIARIPNGLMLRGIDRLQILDGAVRQDVGEDGRLLDTFCVDFTCNRRDIVRNDTHEEPYRRVSIGGLTAEQAVMTSAIIGGERQDDLESILSTGGTIFAGIALPHTRRDFLITVGLLALGGVTATIVLRKKILEALPPELQRIIIGMGNAGNGEPLPPQVLTPAISAPRSPIPTNSATPGISPSPEPTRTRTPNITVTPTREPTVTETPKLGSEIRVTPDKRLVNEKGEILKGSIITQFLYEFTEKSKRLRSARDALRSIKQNGANSVVYVTNAYYFGDPEYLSELATILNESRQQGLSTILSIHSDGSSFKQGDVISVPKQLTKVDASLKEKWNVLLRNKTYGNEIVRNTNAYILIQEAGRDFDWKRDMPYYLDTVKEIRSITSSDIPCSLSGGFWGRRYDGLLTMGPSPLPNLVLNIDPYWEGSPGKGEEALAQIQAMRDLGYTPIIGELGWREVSGGDTIEDVVRRIQIARRDQLAFFIWEMHKWSDLQQAFSSK